MGEKQDTPQTTDEKIQNIKNLIFSHREQALRLEGYLECLLELKEKEDKENIGGE